MKVNELLEYLKKLSSEGKGDYEVMCEAFCVGTDLCSIKVSDKRKEISL